MNAPPASRSKIYVALALLLSFLVACTSATATATPKPTATPEPTGTAEPTATPTPIPPTTTPPPFGDIDIEDVVITLERTVCYGTCPAYVLTIHGDGTVEYIGYENVSAEGLRTGEIAREQVQALVDAFQRSDFFSLQDTYECASMVINGQKVCEEVTDLPSTYVSITVGDHTKRVLDYHGAPEKLRELEALIDGVADRIRWIEPTPTPSP